MRLRGRNAEYICNCLILLGVALIGTSVTQPLPTVLADQMQGGPECAGRSALPNAGIDNTNPKPVAVNGFNVNTWNMCMGSTLEFLASGGGDCDEARGSGSSCSSCPGSPPGNTCVQAWNNGNNVYVWTPSGGISIFDKYGENMKWAYVKAPVNQAGTGGFEVDRVECLTKPDSVDVTPADITINITEPNHEQLWLRYHNTLTGETLSKWAQQMDFATRLRLLKDEDGLNDLKTYTPPQWDRHCCVGFEPGGAPTSFSDWGGYTLRVISNLAEENAVFGLSGNIAIVSGIDNCGWIPFSGAADACAKTNGEDEMIVVSNLSSLKLAHEYGHTATITHSEHSTHPNNLMHVDVVAGGLTNADCTDLHAHD